MYIKPKESNWAADFYLRLKKLPDTGTLNLPDRDGVLKYLKWWNRTRWNNAYSVNLIDYEQLIYFEMKYKDDAEIQNLIQTIKEKTADIYDTKNKWLDLLIDAQLYENVEYIRNKHCYGNNLYKHLNEELGE